MTDIILEDSDEVIEQREESDNENSESEEKSDNGNVESKEMSKESCDENEDSKVRKLMSIKNNQGVTIDDLVK